MRNLEGTGLNRREQGEAGKSRREQEITEGNRREQEGKEGETGNRSKRGNRRK